jgi:hypothetical protein
MRTGKDKRMMDATARDGVAKRAGDRWLTDHGVKGLRTPFSGENLVGH